jgi:hypothetical protein
MSKECVPCRYKNPSKCVPKSHVPFSLKGAPICFLFLFPSILFYVFFLSSSHYPRLLWHCGQQSRQSCQCRDARFWWCSEVPHALRVKPFQRRQKKINSKFPSSWPQHPSWAGHSKFELGSQASAQIRPLARLHRCHPSRPDSERTECRKRNRLRSNMLLVPDQAITSTHNADAELPVNIGKPF